MELALLKHFQSLPQRGDELKDIIQTQAINTWLRANNGNGVITAFTGFGKTVIGIKVMKRLLVKKPESTILIIVPTDNLMLAWTDVMVSLNVKNYKVKVINGYTMNKEADKTVYDLLIVDEVHHCLGKNAVYFNTLLKIVKRQYFLGLSATLRDDHVQYLKDLSLNIDFSINVVEGSRLSIVPEYVIYNLGIELTSIEKDNYARVTRMYEELYKPYKVVAKQYCFKAAMMCATVPINADDTEELNIGYGLRHYTRDEVIHEMCITHGYTQRELVAKANMWLRCMRERESILQKSTNKIMAVKQFLKINTKQALLFTPSIEFANFVYASSKANSIIYHSKIAKGKRIKILESFKQKHFTNLITVKALDEGYDVPGLEVGLNAGFTGVELTFIQRLGRFIRMDKNNLDKVAKLINIYHKPFSYEFDDGLEADIEPMDFKKLKNIQANSMNVKYIKTLDEIEW
jgi:superfamily II DNA or RNA helicase